MNLREIVNGIMYVLSTGCQWRAIPKDLPPRSTVFAYLDLWIYDGTLDRMHYALYEACSRTSRPRGQPYRLHYRQSEREKRRKRGLRIDPPGFDAGKLIQGELGSGMKSVSPGTGVNFPVFQSSLACSIRSLRS